MKVWTWSPDTNDPPARRSWLQWFAGFILRLALIFVGLSLLLVLLLRWMPPPVSSFMVQSYLHKVRSGQEIAPAIDYTWVAYEAVAPPLALAVIAAEDQKFPQHKGFDVAAIRSALQESAQGKPLRGASTISQQVSKNLFLWSGRSFLRKGLEAWFTLLIELFWPKQRILEVYLNIIELGKLTFGVEAASQRFFAKSALQVNRQEAALLAAVLPNPLLYQVNTPSQHVRKRQAWILEQMRRLGGIAYLEEL
jgi:monofunctional biosynthetic peptidoglycan transglycosylase